MQAQYILYFCTVLDTLVLGASSRPDYFFPRPLPMGNVNPFEAEYLSTIITSPASDWPGTPLQIGVC